jgi:hypothetical protein
MTLAEVLAAAAADAALEPGQVSETGTVWSVGELAYATLDASGAVAAFRLDPVLAGAARRTPDTRPSSHGEAWVEFAPRALDDHGADRARAWFIAAARRAEA